MVGEGKKTANPPAHDWNKLSQKGGLESHQRKFFKDIAPEIEKGWAKSGVQVPLEWAVAQIALETGWWTSPSAVEDNNAGGAHKGQSWKGKTTWRLDNQEGKYYHFRKYDTVEDGVVDYLGILSKKHIAAKKATISHHTAASTSQTPLDYAKKLGDSYYYATIPSNIKSYTTILPSIVNNNFPNAKTRNGATLQPNERDGSYILEDNQPKLEEIVTDLTNDPDYKAAPEEKKKELVKHNTQNYLDSSENPEQRRRREGELSGIVQSLMESGNMLAAVVIALLAMVLGLEDDIFVDTIYKNSGRERDASEYDRERKARAEAEARGETYNPGPDVSGYSVDLENYDGGKITAAQAGSARNAKSLNTVHPAMREAALAMVQEFYAEGIPVIVTEGYRSVARSNQLRASGVKAAAGGNSYHNYALAVDVCPEVCVDQKNWNEPKGHEGTWAKVGEIGKKYGFTWGGDWGWDRPHFQVKGTSTKELRKMVANKQVDGHGFVNLPQSFYNKYAALAEAGLDRVERHFAQDGADGKKLDKVEIAKTESEPEIETKSETVAIKPAERENAEQVAANANSKKTLFVGDSLSDGLYKAAIESGREAVDLGEGGKGLTTKEPIPVFDKNGNLDIPSVGQNGVEVKGAKVAHVFFSTNDTKFDRSKSGEYSAQVRSLLEGLLEKGIMPVLIVPKKPDVWTESDREFTHRQIAYMAAAEGLPVPILNIKTVPDLDKLIRKDGEDGKGYMVGKTRINGVHYSSKDYAAILEEADKLASVEYHKFVEYTKEQSNVPTKKADLKDAIDKAKQVSVDAELKDGDFNQLDPKIMAKVEEMLEKDPSLIHA